MKIFFKGYKEGMKEFGETISIVVNSILLSVVYILGVGITKIFSKIKNKEFLELKKFYFWKYDIFGGIFENFP